MDDKKTTWCARCKTDSTKVIWCARCKTDDNVFTAAQISAIRCAFADLLGAWQAVKLQADPFAHDWDAHMESIRDLADAFPDLDLNEGDTSWL